MACSQCAAEHGRADTSDSFERVRYFSRQLITADDLTQDQDYHRERQRLHNRLLHGWGIVCGLEVKAAPTTEAPLNVCISPGYALSCPGDDIYVQSCISLDLAKCTTDPNAGDCTSPCGSAVTNLVDPAKPFYVAIKYAECSSRPVRVPPVGCGCDDTACEYSRIRDGFDISCLTDLPKSHVALDAKDQPSIEKLCKTIGSKIFACAPSCEDSWIVLAKVLLQANAIKTIDAGNRRILLSSAMLQEMIVMDACGKK